MPEWRLLELEARDGATNLAIDETVAEAVAAGEAPPTLRFYTWSAPCLALGSFQSVEDLVPEARAGAGPTLVRRASGGTLVLHNQHHLGFSLALPAGHPLGPLDILEAYRRLNALVAEGLCRLGVNARLLSIEEARATPTDPLLRSACYGGFSPFEIVAQGRKLVGSAQLRRRGMVLHEAGVLLRFDARETARWLAAPTPEQAERRAALLAARVTDLERERGRAVTLDEVAQALCASLGPALGDTTPSRSKLSSTEHAHAEALGAGKYADPGWTSRR